MSRISNRILKLTVLAISLSVLGGCVSAKKNPNDEPAMAAPAPVAETVTYSIYAMELKSDETFAFDSDQLSQGSMQDLDTVVAAVSKFKSPELIITGYTDRFGSDAYNLDLSQRRADAVAAYLSSKGVPAGGILTKAMGSSNPLVQCDTGLPRDEAIACLAPNRRTTVEFPSLDAIKGANVVVIKEAEITDAGMIEAESKKLMDDVAN